jgi:hypothetical protein
MEHFAKQQKWKMAACLSPPREPPTSM